MRTIALLLGAILCAEMSFSAVPLDAKNTSVMADQKKACDAGEKRKCIGLALSLQNIGRGAEGEKLLRKSCTSRDQSACVALAVYFNPRDAADMLQKSCKVAPDVCQSQAQAFAYGNRFVSHRTMMSTMCTLTGKKCPSDNEINQYEKKFAKAIDDAFKQSSAEVQKVRNKNKKKPVDFDLSKMEWDAIEKNIAKKEVLNKRVRVPVATCGPISSISKTKWMPVTECSGGSSRVRYNFVVDNKQATKLLQDFGFTVNSLTWMTGTVVELRPTGVVDAMVIVID